MDSSKTDFFLFGATSELAQRLFKDEADALSAHIHKLVLVQRSDEIADVYKAFNPVVVRADAANSSDFRQTLATVVEKHTSEERRVDVLSTYGVFHFRGGKTPCFLFSDEGLQINLNARLQIVEAFRPLAARTRFHLLGSLLGSFPYLGDYALSMWFVNQLPKHPEYRDLDLRVYNLGGMKTRFWDHTAHPESAPFLHPEVPTAWLREHMLGANKGAFDNFPTFMARVACTLGRMGLRVM